MSAAATTQPPPAPAAAAPAPKLRNSNWALTRRLLSLSWIYRRPAARVLAYQLALKGLMLLGLNLIGLGVDVILHHVAPRADAAPPHWPLGLSPPASWSLFRQVVLVSVLVIAIALVRAALQYTGAIAAQRLIQQIVVHLRSQVYDKLQRLSFRFYDANESGSIINRVAGDVQNVRLFVDGVVIQTTVVALSLVAYIAYMLTINAKLTLACLAPTPLLVIAAITFSRLVRPAHHLNKKIYDNLIRALSENFQGVHVVKGFGLQQSEIKKFQRINTQVKEQQQFIFWCISVFHPLMGFLTQINLIILLVLGGWQFVQGRMSLGNVLVFAWVLQQFSTDVFNIAGIANNVQESLIGAERVFEVLDTPVEIQNAPAHVLVHRPRLTGAVKFEHVTFGYDPRDPVLNDVSFAVEPGMCVAIVGATGAGKSTLLSLIPRFYDPQRGRVLIDGIDARTLDVDELRRNIGLVFQESFLFSHTVAANIAFGHPEATRQQIEKAARIASADGFILDLKQGYDTYIGERGGDLSGGQRQRLAIARAVLLEPPILILDDPTAAIDPQTEHEILQAMDSAMQNRTTFVVAHRLSTLRRADLVLVLEDGRIVQQGTHDELMATSGHYQEAARLQVADMESKALLGVKV